MYPSALHPRGKARRGAGLCHAQVGGLRMQTVSHMCSLSCLSQGLILTLLLVSLLHGISDDVNILPYKCSPAANVLRSSTASPYHSPALPLPRHSPASRGEACPPGLRCMLGNVFQGPFKLLCSVHLREITELRWAG